MNSLITIYKIFFIIFLGTSLLNKSFSQCLDPNGIGSFETPSDLSSWFTATEDNGSFAITQTGSFYGDSHLKVNVNTDSPWQVRMFNGSGCYFSMTAGEVFTVSFYAKGRTENDFSVTLMDSLTNIETITQKITLDEWSYYTLTLTSNITTSNGRLKFNFISEGAYEIDEITISSGSFKTWYVSPTGNNSISGNNGQSTSQPLQTINYAINTAWSEGDLIYVMDGTYQNNGYASTNLNNPAVVSINKSGALNGPLVIRNAPGHQPKIEFDGAGGFICGTGKFIEISGFEIQGPNGNITKTEAESNRLTTDKYYKGRGIAIWAGSGGNHILLHSNKVYDCPGSGIRINNSDYCIITQNEVYNCTNWSSAAESGLVIAQSKAMDTHSKIKMRITKNRVYNNVNKIHYYNSTYACNNTTDYGCIDFPDIIDGSGCYITRNNDRGSGGPDENPNGQYTGYYYFANNICYGNGINGLVVHKSDNSIVMNNTCYLNGQVPVSEGRQNAVGITVNNSNGVRIYNNISWTELTTDYGYQVFGSSSDLVGSNNIIVTGQSNISSLTNMSTSDPLFIDAVNYDFRLDEGSPALDSGETENNISLLHETNSSEYIPMEDIDHNTRLLTINDIGAHELLNTDLKLNIKALLQGPISNFSAPYLMDDTLRINNNLSTTSPYNDSLNCTNSVFNISGENAIVDWVWIELRDANNFSTILASKSALIQRDGDIVNIDGSSHLSFDLPNNEYYILVNHRNHLSIMSQNFYNLSSSVTTIDLTKTINIYGGNNAVTHIAAETYAMFSGDYDENGQIQTTDSNLLINQIGNSGYHNADLDMNGQVQTIDLNNYLLNNIGNGIQF